MWKLTFKQTDNKQVDYVTHDIWAQWDSVLKKLYKMSVLHISLNWTSYILKYIHPIREILVYKITTDFSLIYINLLQDGITSSYLCRNYSRC